MSQDGPPSHPTPAEAVEAGLYYFAREDFSAARKWWEYALAVDPHNVRAHECLRILGRTTGVGQVSMDLVRATAATSRDHEPIAEAEVYPAAHEDVDVDGDEPSPDDEPTEAVARPQLVAASTATRVREEEPPPVAARSASEQATAAVDQWSRPAQSTARPSPIDVAWSSARAEPAPAHRTAFPEIRTSEPRWAEDDPRAAAAVAAPGSPADQWSRAAGDVRPGAAQPDAPPLSVWSRPVGAGRPTEDAAADLAEPIDLGSWSAESARTPPPTIEVGPPAPEVPSSRPLPPIPAGARPLAPVGAGRAPPYSGPPQASDDLGHYPSMPHRAPPDEAARPSVLRFDPLGFEASGSWGPPASLPVPAAPAVPLSPPAGPAPSSLERWSRPSVPAPGNAAPAAPRGVAWDPGDQLRIDGGIGVLDGPPARRSTDGRPPRVELAPHDPEWEAEVHRFATGDLAAIATADPRAVTERAAALAPPAAPPAPRADQPAVASATRGGRGQLEVTGRLATAAVPTPPRGYFVSTNDLRRAGAIAGINTADLRRPGAVTADMVAAPQQATPREPGRPEPFDPFGPPSEPPSPAPPAAPASPRGELANGFVDPFGSLDPFATPGAGAARPPSVFKSGPPLPEARTFSVERDEPGRGTSTPGAVDELSAEELMGDAPPARRSPSADFEMVIEEPEEAPPASVPPPAPSSPNALAFALSAFESASEPDIIAVDPRPSAPSMPWDEGPAETSHVTVAQDIDDAVAELTPLPVLDRQPLFQLHGTPPPPLSPVPRSPAHETGRTTPSPIGDEPSQIFERARARFMLHDFDGALELLEKIPPQHPAYEEARDVLAETRHRLDDIYSSKIGSLDAAPRVLLSGDQLIWLNLNHRAGFILSQVDGGVTYDDLISLSGMPRLDTLRILCTLLQEGVIGTD